MCGGWRCVLQGLVAKILSPRLTSRRETKLPRVGVVESGLTHWPLGGSVHPNGGREAGWGG